MKSNKSIAGQLISNYRSGSNRKIRNQLGLARPAIPYMKLKEIDLLKEIFESFQPMNLLEYGCGYSTLYFPKFLPQKATWYSIEHHKEWFELIAQKLGEESKRVHLHLVNPDHQKENIPEDTRFSNFVNYPERLGPFDFILVDGMARKRCISKSKELLNKNGLLVVHDANRVEYHDEIKKFPHWMIFTDFRKTSGGIAFASMDNPIESYFDFDYHKKIWVLDNKVNNFFKFKFLIGKRGKPLRIHTSRSGN